MEESIDRLDPDEGGSRRRSGCGRRGRRWRGCRRPWRWLFRWPWPAAIASTWGRAPARGGSRMRASKSAGGRLPVMGLLIEVAGFGLLILAAAIGQHDGGGIVQGSGPSAASCSKARTRHAVLWRSGRLDGARQPEKRSAITALLFPEHLRDCRFDGVDDRVLCLLRLPAGTPPVGKAKAWTLSKADQWTSRLAAIGSAGVATRIRIARRSWQDPAVSAKRCESFPILERSVRL